jgi:hypothetical protein
MADVPSSISGMRAPPWALASISSCYFSKLLQLRTRALRLLIVRSRVFRLVNPLAAFSLVSLAAWSIVASRRSYLSSAKAPAASFPPAFNFSDSPAIFRFPPT